MNIGFDAKRAFHNTSGLGNYSRDLIRILSKTWTSDEFFLFNPKEPKLNFDYNTSNSQIVQPVKGFYKKSGSIWRQFRVAKLAEQLGVDLYHGLSNELPTGIVKAKVKSVVTIHDLIFERYPEWYQLIDRNIYHKKFKSAAERADKIVAISEQTKNDLIEFYQIPESKIQVVYQSCHEAFQKKFKKESFKAVQEKFNLPEQFILSVGTIEQRKNIKIVVEALEAFPEIPLVLVGRLTSYGTEVLDWVKSKGMEGRVLHLKGVSMHELAMVYRLAQIFVYPSIFEGFGIPIIEALFSGTPVITSTGSCFSESGGEGSMYVDPHNTKQWKEAIEYLWNNEAIQKDMILKGNAHVQQFTDQNIVNNWTSLYNQFR